MSYSTFLITLVFFLAACGNTDSFQANALNSNLPEDNAGLSPGPDNPALEPEPGMQEPVVIINPDLPVVEEPPRIDGPQVCYENDNFDSCHAVVDKNQLATPGEYVYPNSSSLQYRSPDAFIDIFVEGTSKFVSPNFKRSEYIQSWKGRYGLLAPQLVYRVQRMRDAIALPININSGYRSPTYNDGVGGASLSRHMFGDAVDFKVGGRSPEQLVKYCQDQGASFIQTYTSHIHCDWRNLSLASEFFPPILNTASLMTKAMEKNLNHDSHMEFYGHFEIEKQESADGKLTFNIHSHDLEDGEGNLTVKWQVMRDNKVVAESSAQSVRFSQNQGSYVVQATVGSAWVKHISFQVD